MTTKQDYIDAINEKFDERLSKASKTEEKSGPGGTGPDSDGAESGISAKGEYE